MAMTGPTAFQARLKAMVDSRNQREQMLEAERMIYIAKRREHREQESRARQCQQTGSKFYVKAEEITWDMKAIEDQSDATTLALNVLELKRRSLSEELFELQRKRDSNRNFYDCEGAKMIEFKLELRDCESTVPEDKDPSDELNSRSNCESTIQTEDTKPSDECDLEKARQVGTASDCDAEDDTKISESERTRLMSAKEAIRRNVCSYRNTVGVLEQRLHEALLRSGTRKRDLATGVETLRTEITGLQTTERNLEDRVLQAITRRDKKKRELHDLECELAQKKRSFYGREESQNTVSERSEICARSQEKTAAIE